MPNFLNNNVKDDDNNNEKSTENNDHENAIKLCTLYIINILPSGGNDENFGKHLLYIWLRYLLWFVLWYSYYIPMWK